MINQTGAGPHRDSRKEGRYTRSEARRHAVQEDLEKICEECGNDLVCEGWSWCSDCLERNEENEMHGNGPYEPEDSLDTSGSAVADANGVIYGPCPGCEAWQLSVPAEAYSLYGFGIFGEVNEIIREHSYECAGLLALAREKGVV